jgi:uncharacterized protein YuzE
MKESQILIRYDADADAAYVRLAHPPAPDPLGTGRFRETHVMRAAHTDWPGELNVDVDAEGRILGIEILGARRVLPHEML